MKRKNGVLAGAAVLVAVTAAGSVVVMSSAKQATPAAQEPLANTVKVEKGKRSATASRDGTAGGAPEALDGVEAVNARS